MAEDRSFLDGVAAGESAVERMGVDDEANDLVLYHLSWSFEDDDGTSSPPSSVC